MNCIIIVYLTRSVFDWNIIRQLGLQIHYYYITINTFTFLTSFYFILTSYHSYMYFIKHILVDCRF